MEEAPSPAPPPGPPPDPSLHPREAADFYIGADGDDVEAMLGAVGLGEVGDVFAHVPDGARFRAPPRVCGRLGRGELAARMEGLAGTNRVLPSFLGDGLQSYGVHGIVPFVAGIRGLSTAYTPYQPERSQGTLHSLWLYAGALSALTGFEAVSASLYDRSTALFEACAAALRAARGKGAVLVSGGLHPADLEVLSTHARGTGLRVVPVPMDRRAGVLDEAALAGLLARHRGDVAAFAFPQVNHFGVLEDVDRLTDLGREAGAAVVGVVDPMLLGAAGGLKEPSAWGGDGRGADMVAGEGQHLALGPNYGGPGLGVFGVRFDGERRRLIRGTAGRFVGKARDARGRECFCMVLSTREQHIRRERATSNICSNQSFVATLAGASLLARGAPGLAAVVGRARENALRAHALLTSREGLVPAFDAPFFNEFTLETPVPPRELIGRARARGLHLGVDVSARGGRDLLMVSCSDLQGEGHFRALEGFLDERFPRRAARPPAPPPVPPGLARGEAPRIPAWDEGALRSLYSALGEQNVSPDDDLYPLGSCTMKYNPRLNDWAAALPGFAGLHPQVPEEDAQGTLEVLHFVQEAFKSVTGLPGAAVTPVAGAQGELAGLKMFQAWHRDRGEGDRRRTVLVPGSAHGTNPATAAMAGFPPEGIVTVGADASGRIDMDDLARLVALHGRSLAGVMVTNPNTSGVFEDRFREAADMVHAAGGLVYMDGANMNAIAGWVDLGAMGVDAVHNNLHKTWSIPHGGGGPGDAVVCVGERLLPYLPGVQVRRSARGLFETFRAERSIGSFHRHFGNVAHKVRAAAYLMALGDEGVRRMSAVAVLSARYLEARIGALFPTLPEGARDVPRMHEFIITLDQAAFRRIEEAGVPRAEAVPRIGKLFSDFGLHAPTVAFPERFGLMVEPTESYSRAELDRFVEVLRCIGRILDESPEVLATVPHFTPVSRVEEAEANRSPVLSGPLGDAPPRVPPNAVRPGELRAMDPDAVRAMILEAHRVSAARA